MVHINLYLYSFGKRRDGITMEGLQSMAIYGVTNHEAEEGQRTIQVAGDAPLTILLSIDLYFLLDYGATMLKRIEGICQ